VAYAAPADGSDKRTPKELVEAAILVRHPLQSFSPKYFDGREPSLFSYSEADRHACVAIRSGQAEEVVLFPEPLPTESVRRVSLDELCRFVRNPAKYLFNKRLGISYWSEEDILEGDEPLVVGKAEARSIRKALVEGIGRGVAAADERTVFARLSADAMLPVGLPGRTGFSGEVRQMSPVLEAGRLLLEKERIPALAGTLRIAGWELDVEIASGLTTDGYFEVQARSLKGKEILPFWAKYLAVSLLHPHAGDLSGSLLGIGEDRKKEELRPDLLTFRRDDAAREVLQDLLGWYEVGLTRPIRLFPNSCWEYALGFGAEKNVSAAMEKAERAWVASDWGRGESQDDYFNRVFPSDASAFDDEFRLLAGKFAVRAFSSLADGPKPPKKVKQGKEGKDANVGKEVKVGKGVKVGKAVKVGKGGKKG
jgi:exodeoxyribonuclease V gamma subunit